MRCWVGLAVGVILLSLAVSFSLLLLRAGDVEKNPGSLSVIFPEQAEMKPRVVCRLSPNEEATLLRHQREERRRARLVQVREQERAFARRVREEVQSKREVERRLLEQHMQATVEASHKAELRELEQRLLSRMTHLGQGHRDALHINQEENRLQELRVLLAAKQRERAQDRHTAAMKELTVNQVHEREMKQHSLQTKRHAQEVERQRAQGVAAKPPPPPSLIMDLAVGRGHRVRLKEVEGYASSYYHIPHNTVQRAETPELFKPSAQEMAQRVMEEDKRIKMQSAAAQQEQMEKARLRYQHAMAKVRLEKEKTEILNQLEVLEREDRASRQKVLPNIPANMFQPVQRRIEMANEQQRDMEQAFEKLFVKTHGVHTHQALSEIAEPSPPEVTPSHSSQSEEQSHTHSPPPTSQDTQPPASSQPAQESEPDIRTQHPPGIRTQHPPGIRTQHPPGIRTQHPPGIHTQHPPGIHTQHPPGIRTQHPPGINTQHPPGIHTQHPPGIHIEIPPVPMSHSDSGEPPELSIFNVTPSEDTSSSRAPSSAATHDTNTTSDHERLVGGTKNQEVTLGHAPVLQQPKQKPQQLPQSAVPKTSEGMQRLVGMIWSQHQAWNDRMATRAKLLHSTAQRQPHDLSTMSSSSQPESLSLHTVSSSSGHNTTMANSETDHREDFVVPKHKKRERGKMPLPPSVFEVRPPQTPPTGPSEPSPSEHYTYQAPTQLSLQQGAGIQQEQAKCPLQSSSTDPTTLEQPSLSSSNTTAEEETLLPQPTVASPMLHPPPPNMESSPHESSTSRVASFEPTLTYTQNHHPLLHGSTHPVSSTTAHTPQYLYPYALYPYQWPYAHYYHAPQPVHIPTTPQNTHLASSQASDESNSSRESPTEEEEHTERPAETPPADESPLIEKEGVDHAQDLAAIERITKTVSEELTENEAEPRLSSQLSPTPFSSQEYTYGPMEHDSTASDIDAVQLLPPLRTVWEDSEGQEQSHQFYWPLPADDAEEILRQRKSVEQLSISSLESSLTTSPSLIATSGRDEGAHSRLHSHYLQLHPTSSHSPGEHGSLHLPFNVPDVHTQPQLRNRFTRSLSPVPEEITEPEASPQQVRTGLYDSPSSAASTPKQFADFPSPFHQDQSEVDSRNIPTVLMEEVSPIGKHGAGFHHDLHLASANRRDDELSSSLAKQKLSGSGRNPRPSATLSLQEAFLLRKQEFIRKSQSRIQQLETNASQRHIQAAQQKDSVTHSSPGRRAHKTPTQRNPLKKCMIQSPTLHTPVTTESSERRPAVTFSSPLCQPQDTGIFSPPNFNKAPVQRLPPSMLSSQTISAKEMKERNLRFYSRLPEVRGRRREEKRALQYAANREKARHYGQKVRGQLQQRQRAVGLETTAGNKGNSCPKRPPFK